MRLGGRARGVRSTPSRAIRARREEPRGPSHALSCPETPPQHSRRCRARPGHPGRHPHRVACLSGARPREPASSGRARRCASSSRRRGSVLGEAKRPRSASGMVDKGWERSMSPAAILDSRSDMQVLLRRPAGAEGSVKAGMGHAARRVGFSRCGDLLVRGIPALPSRPKSLKTHARRRARWLGRC
jgi:hypothetical protein